MLKEKETYDHILAISRYWREIPANIRYFPGIMPMYAEKKRKSMLISAMASYHLTGYSPSTYLIADLVELKELCI